MSQLVTACCHSSSLLRRAPAVCAIRVGRAAPDLADEAELGEPLEIALDGAPSNIGQQLFGVVLVGAQAVYLRVGAADMAVAPCTMIATKPMSYRKLTAVLATPSSTVTVLADTFPAPADPMTSTIHAPIDTVVREHARRVVADLGGNKAKAARVLGIARNTLCQLLSPALADSAADDE